MRKWNLKTGDPLELTIAADSRLCQPDYTDDQIWKVHLGGGDPAAILLQSSLGLRCRWVRLFPRFTVQKRQFCDPAGFHRPPELTCFSPSFLSFSCAPTSDLESVLEYRVVNSQTVAGIIRLLNNTPFNQPVLIEWCAMIKPLRGGRSFLPLEPGSLYGQSGDLFPVCFLSGPTEMGPGSLPSLARPVDIEPGREVSITWGFSARSDTASSLAAATQAAASPWEAEAARVERIHQSQSIQITTGRPDWDAVFALAQKSAQQLIFPASRRLPHPTFVLTRQPDDGFSSRGDGADFNHRWDGQTPLDLYALASLILPGDSTRLRGMIENFIDLQEPDGFIDMKPGLAGQRAYLLAPPLLATLSLTVFLYQPDREWMGNIFPRLLKFFELWFDPAHDKDRDGFPEWDHAVQAGLEDIQLFDRWNDSSQGIQASVLESPSLAAFLYREAHSLIRIANLAGHPEAIPDLEQKMARLKEHLEHSWDSHRAIFHYRDFQNHQCFHGFRWISFSGSGRFHSRRVLPVSQRVLIQVHCEGQTPCPLYAHLLGEDENGEVTEIINSDHWKWNGDTARATSQRLFRQVKAVEIQGLQDEDEGRILACDLMQEDASLFLPLWAGMASKEQAADMVKKSLKRFQHSAGVSLIPADRQSNPEIVVRMIWNLFLVEGLLDYGFQQEAAGIVSSMIEGAVQSLDQKQSFSEQSLSQGGKVITECGNLRGILPVGLFLKTLGVQFLSEKELIISGNNPFPWPITVQYRGTSITRHPQESMITFLNGQTITVTGTAKQKVILE